MLPARMEDFEDAATSYVHALAKWQKATLNLYGEQATLRNLERDLDYAEAEVRMNGALESAKNAEERAARLLLALRVDPAYSAIIRQVATTRNRSLTFQAEAMAEHDLMSLAKRRMDFVLAALRYGTKGALNNNEEGGRDRG